MLKTVRDLGMPFYERNWENGNLYLEFNIIFPTILDNNQQQLIEKVLKNIILGISKPKKNWKLR